MSKNPLVSIIIPCYNYGRFLSEALNSLLEQSYTNWECIIVNDGSNDNTEETALQYVKTDQRFIYKYQHNQGQWAGRNHALALSNGKYIQFLDADDMLQTEKLKLQVELLESNSSIDLVYGDILMFHENSAEPRKFILYHQPAKFPIDGPGENILNALLIDNFFLPGCVLMKKNVFDHLEHAFRRAYGLEDWDLWYRMATANFSFYHDSRDGTRLLTRHHGANVSSKEEKMLADRLNVRKMILTDLIRLKKLDMLDLRTEFIDKTIAEHRRLIAREKASYYLNYGNVLVGFVSIAEHAYYSGKPFYAFYDGAHYLKERFRRYIKRG